MIPPKKWEPFVSNKDALTRLKAMGLVSTSKKQLDDYAYKGAYSSRFVECKVVGTAGPSTLVISIDDELHCINVDYFAEVQPPKQPQKYKDMYAAVSLPTNRALSKFDSFVVLDFETTGLSPDDEEIIDIGCIKVEKGEIVGEFSTLVNPGRHIPSNITEKTGISDEDVKDAPVLDGVLGGLLDFIGELPIVGHNVNFDVRFLCAACCRHGYENEHFSYFDTLTLARKCIDETENHKLDTLVEALELDGGDTHRALNDARYTLQILDTCRGRTLGTECQPFWKKERSMVAQQSFFDDEPLEDAESSGEKLNARELERQFYESIQPKLLKILDDYGISPNNLEFEPTKSGYSSLRYRDAVVCTLKLGPVVYRIGVPAGELRELDDRGIAHEGLASSGLIRIPLQAAEEAGKYAEYICGCFQRAIERYPKQYSCCAYYMECSDAGRCVNTRPEIAVDCSYNYKLRKGIVFFGKNRNA